MHSIVHGDDAISFQLVRSDRRTLGFTVRRDGSVVVRAPRRACEADVLRSVAGRAEWILRKQREFAESAARTPPLRYEEGEAHLYLGRPYPLALEQGDVETVRLAGDALRVTVRADASTGHVKDLLDAWYVRRARGHLPARLDACWATFPSNGHQRPTLRLKHMRTRWGSMSPKGNMSLRLDLIRAPDECIDYVILHELCHLAHPNHGREFWALVERLVPDWKRRKRLLESLLS
ncbi:MAG: SprT family zinc-dependent metalloprotease [Thermoleophilia bacterium]|jgi:predicted metal-dependent hydrolase|nr:SprT family zinc-dependent metalloprotease [Thermoleophilia bacterium]